VFGNDYAFGWGRSLAVCSDLGNKIDGKETIFEGSEKGGSMSLEVCISLAALARLAVVADTHALFGYIGIGVYSVPNWDHSSKKRRNPHHGVKYTPIHRNTLLSKQAVKWGFKYPKARVEALTRYIYDHTPLLLHT
jgi:hypothetical protein